MRIKYKVKCYPISCLLIFFSFFSNELSASIKTYTLDWNSTPFITDEAGTYNWKTYAIGHKNITFAYYKSGFEVGYPARKNTYHGSYARRLEIMSSGSGKASMEIVVDDLQQSLQNYVDYFAFKVHDIDDYNQLKIIGYDANGNEILPSISSGSTFDINVSDLTISGHGVSSSNLEGTANIIFYQSVRRVVIELSDQGGSKSDHSIVVDNMVVKMNDPYFYKVNPSHHLIWDNWNYFPGSTNMLFQNSQESGTDIYVTVTGSTAGLSSGYPVDNDELPIIDPFGYKENLVLKGELKDNQSVSVTFSFSKPVSGLQFSIGDIDNKITNNSNTNMSESIHISGYKGSVDIEPFLYSENGGSSYSFSSLGKVGTSKYVEDQVSDINIERSILHVYFNDYVDEFTIEISNEVFLDSEGNFDIGISSLHYHYSQPKSFLVEGSIYHDINYNGQYDSGEKSLKGVSVYCFKSGDTSSYMTKTGDGINDYDGDGYPEPAGKYFFNVTEGDYDIIVIQPSGYLQTDDPDNNIDNQTSLSVESKNVVVKPFGYIYEEAIPDKRTTNRSSQRNSHALFHVYPNPTAGYISFKGMDLGTMISFDIIDIQGRKYQSAINISAREFIDVTSLPPGLFLMVIYTDEKIITKSFTRL